MRLMFGACTNEWSPSDGKVVSVDHGCGAHSQTTVEHGPTQWPAADPVFASDVVVAFDLGAADAVVAEPVVAEQPVVADDAMVAQEPDVTDAKAAEADADAEQSSDEPAEA